MRFRDGRFEWPGLVISTKDIFQMSIAIRIPRRRCERVDYRDMCETRYMLALICQLAPS
jgi:hypothetical protein